jgi:rubredoxin
MSRYRCPGCDYLYDEERGHPHEGFPPGTSWSVIPEDWVCPDCGVRDKLDFTLTGTGEPADDQEDLAG